jgi:excisionase family DNA binding protein
MNHETLMTPAQVAQRLQVTERTVASWLRTGRLPGVKLGRLWRVHPAALQAAVKNDMKRDEFDEPLTTEEAAASEAAWQAYISGDDPGESLETVRRQLLVERRD